MNMDTRWEELTPGNPGRDKDMSEFIRNIVWGKKHSKHGKIEQNFFVCC